MEIEFTLQPQDFLAFARYWRRLRSVQPSPSLTFRLGFFAIIFIGVAGAGFAHGYFGKEPASFSMIAAAFFGMLLQQCWHRGWYRAFRKRQCEDPRNVYGVRDVRVVISPEKVQTISRQSTTTYDWSVVWHIGVTPNQIFLFITTWSAIIIPRRVFANAAHCEEFIALVREYQQGRAQQRPKSTGIITGLPPQSDAFTRPEVT